MIINYQPTTWNNEQEPPISAENLNHIEQGIKATADRVDELVTVEANPSGTPTDRLIGLEVDGNIYEVGGGHKVYTDGGTLLPQQPNMVVKGVYSKDNATSNITEIEVVREFQNDAEVQALTGEAAKGFQHTPDNVYRARAAADITFDPTNTLLTQTRMQEAMEELDAEHLPYSSTQSTKQKIDEIAGKILFDTTQITTGNTLWNGYYYGDKLNLPANVVIDNLMVKQTTDNSPTIVMLINGSDNAIRALTVGASKTVTVKYLYHLSS